MEDDWSSLLVAERLGRIRDALERFRSQTSLYFVPEIPAAKLANARAMARVPEAERVLALIDCTVFGSAKNCIAFAGDAIYIHNSNARSVPDHSGCYRFPYERLPEVRFAKQVFDVEFTDGAARGTVECAGSSFSTAQLVALFETLASSVRARLRNGDQGNGVSIAPHFVERSCLDATNDHWPSGIAAHADASVISPGLELRWERELGPIRHTPVVARDFVVVVIEPPTPSYLPINHLVGLELTTGREYWRRELPRVFWSRPVAALGQLLLKGGAYWHAFDLETGEARAIDVPGLSRGVRDQLVLADAAIDKPEGYSTWADELAFPMTTEAIPPLRAANRDRRVYAFSGLQELAPSLRIVDHRRGPHHDALHNLHGDRRGELISLAMTEQHILAGTRDGELHIAEAEPLVWVRTIETHTIIEHLAVGSDHVVTAGNQLVRCYR